VVLDLLASSGNLKVSDIAREKIELENG
jgi:hypothetical protein